MLYCLSVHDRISDNLLEISILCAVCILVAVLTSIKRYKGGGTMKTDQFYSYEEESRIKKIHAYASHNKALIEKSQKCYCFYCKNVMDSSEINRYLDEEETALCPKCGIDSIIPDGIDENIDKGIIEEMHDYWF